MKKIGAIHGFMAIFAITLPLFAPPCARAGLEEGTAAYNGGDYATALKEIRPLAEQGHPKAQYFLGRMYSDGLDGPPDFAEAVKWYRRSADQGDVQGQNSLGYMYGHGLGVPRDQTEAIRWYRLAAGTGHPKAQHNLGVTYEFGHGVPKDFTEAIKWYRLAADQGYSDAQHNLARMYYYGKGVPQDFAEAIKWHRRAADQGHVGAQSILGYMYDTALGVPRDSAEAIKWYRLAADQGDVDAQRELKARVLWPELTGSFGWVVVFVTILLFVAVAVVLKRRFLARRVCTEEEGIREGAGIHMTIGAQTGRAKLLTAALFIFCGIPGVLAFAFSSIFLFAALSGSPIRGLEQPSYLIAISAIGAFLTLIGIRKLGEWMYILVFLTVPASLMLFDWLNYKLHLTSGLLESGVFMGLVTFVTLKCVGRFYENNQKGEGPHELHRATNDSKS